MSDHSRLKLLLGDVGKGSVVHRLDEGNRAHLQTQPDGARVISSTMETERIRGCQTHQAGQVVARLAGEPVRIPEPSNVSEHVQLQSPDQR